MNSEKEYPALEQLMKLYNGLVLPALQEGGVNFAQEAFWVSVWLTNSFTVTLGEYDLLLEVDVAPGEDPVTGKIGQIKAELSLKDRGPTVTFVRRSDKETWHISARGTLGLPNGHPIGDLAHRADLLAFEANRMETEVDDKRAFQVLKRVGHILEHQSL